MIRTLGKVTDQALVQIKEEMGLRKTNEVFLLFALGSQFDHLIHQALAKLGVFCLVADPGKVHADDVKRVDPKGIILSGGPVSVYQDKIPFDVKIFDLKIPVLGICLGFQMWAQHVGCKVKAAPRREFGVHELMVEEPVCSLFAGCQSRMKVLQSHGDSVDEILDQDFNILAFTENVPVNAAHYKHLWGVQFHPEVSETPDGSKIFENFCFGICKAKDKYPAPEVADQKSLRLFETIGDKKVLLALSGGSDSSTVAYLLRNAVFDKKRLRGVYIKGIDRPEDEANVLRFFDSRKWISLEIVDATLRFLEALKGVVDGREKRNAMRKVYHEVLEEKIQEFGASFIAQGTLYTDISESGGGYDTSSRKDRIKLHHNVGLKFSVPELTPLDDQVKDTARDIGRSIGVPEVLLTRHPFPGPGFVLRIEGEVTADKLRIARQVDAIFIEELHSADLYKKIWQAGVQVTSSQSTWTKGDGAGKGIVVCLWVKNSTNGFTATRTRLPEDFVDKVARRIGNEVEEVARITLDVTGKPPATIEWE